LSGVDLHRLAVTACSRWQGDPDYEDFVQEAVASGLSAHGVTTEGSMVWVMRMRVIDLLRRRDQYKSGGERRWRITTTLCDRHDRSTAPEELSISAQLGITGRDGWIVDRLAEGWPKEAIASSLGVSPGRVSQLLGALRHQHPNLRHALLSTAS
jgi:hypothetical protein